MRNRLKPLVFATTLGLGVAMSAASASAITIDGDLSDWGITVADGNNSNFSSPSPTIGLVSSFIEDQNDSAGAGGYVGPNYGAEYMGVAVQGNMMYIAIVSGQRPDNGLSNYSPGDIYMTTPVGIVGIEVGGGIGGGAGGLITEGDAGSTYNVNSTGHTVSLASTNAAQTAGSVWANANWIQDPIAPASPVQMDTSSAGTQIGNADFAYTRNTQTNQHSVIELALDISNLLDEDGNGSIGIHWSPACGNDIVTALIHVTAPITNTEVPEPGSALVWLVGVSMIGAMRARRLKRS
jgi:hypothetical protein